MTTKPRQADDLSLAEAKAHASNYPVARHGPYCHAETRTKHDRTRYRFTCTREANHEGPHVAHVPGGDAIAVWTEDGE